MSELLIASQVRSSADGKAYRSSKLCGILQWEPRCFVNSASLHLRNRNLAKNFGAMSRMEKILPKGTHVCESPGIRRRGVDDAEVEKHCKGGSNVH